ncbi:MAG TPA: hypothetical protein VGJ84_04715 [Polyangiaceae bacterium]|jgi:hypothetical protein
MRAALWLLVACWIVCWAQELRAEQGKTWVSLQVVSDDPEFVTRVTSGLRAGLARANIAVLPAGAAELTAPVASIRLSVAQGLVSVTIDVADAVTKKRVIREIDLKEVPLQDQSFAVAVATEELLRASWAELALDTAAARAASAPETVKTVVRRSLSRGALRVQRPSPNVHPPSPTLKNEVAVELPAFEYYPASYVEKALLIGASAGYAHWLTQHFAPEASLGLTSMVPVKAEHGTVGGYTVWLGLKAVFRPLLVGDKYGVDFTAGTRLGAALFQGEPRSPHQGFTKPRGIWTLELSTRIHARLGERMRVGVRGSLNPVLHGARLTDSGKTVAGIEGLGVGLGLWGSVLL